MLLTQGWTVRGFEGARAPLNTKVHPLAAKGITLK